MTTIDIVNEHNERLRNVESHVATLYLLVIGLLVAVGALLWRVLG